MRRQHRSLVGRLLSDHWDSVTGKNRPPWNENWELDDKFFKHMGAWETQYPESTLAKVIENVNAVITTGGPFLEHIPDSPFPARSLVQGLAHLLQLGTEIASARKESYDFTMQVLVWFYAVEASFGASKTKKFTSQARKNLAVIQNLINAICTWGWARLSDKRWMSLLNGLAISGEIRLFKEKLTEIGDLFATMQDINLAIGVHEILTEISVIKRYTKGQFDKILDHLKERELIDERRRYLEKTLNFNIALQRTAYDDQGKPPCDIDTRIDILADITTWVNDVSSRSQNIFWLTGDSGCGKSAIAASLARYCKDAGILWAQFFINRNNEVTTNPRVYFPSIVRQMAEHSLNKTVVMAIYDILKANPSLMDGMTLDQARVLFVQVVQVACDLDKGKPVVIVIDGLDETSRKSLQDTATIFSKLFKELKRPNAKVFISSRTDDEITKPFYRSLQTNKGYVLHLHLDTSDPSSFEDVSRYLSRNLQRLVEEWDLNWEIWPGRERFENLCLRADGHFGWAVTVMKFFNEQLRSYGHERLDTLLDAVNAEGMGDVNQVYRTILNTTYGPNPSTWQHETFRWVVGFMIGLKEPLPLEDVGFLLDLRRTPTSNPVDILHFATNFRTILIPGIDPITKETTPRPPKSFVEFITSDNVDEAFRIDLSLVDVEIALKCLQLVSRLRNSDDRSRIPPASARYAIQNWTRHLSNEGNPSGVVTFGEEAFSRAYTSNVALRKSRMSVAGDYRTHMYDPGQGLPPPFHFIHGSTLKVGHYVLVVAVSLDGRLIASGSDTGLVYIWDSTSHVLIGEPLNGHSNPVVSLCFSPDSRWLVSGSWDKSIRVWDCQTGHAEGSPLLGHSNDVKSVCTDGGLIISGSLDQTICIWDFSTRKQIGVPINAGGYVFAVALSNDGRIAAGVGNTVCVWDVKTRNSLASIKGHASRVYTVAFSPDDSCIGSGSADNYIRLWDARTYTQIREFTGHADTVWSVSFSPDGRYIASGSNDESIRVWNSDTSQLIDPPLQDHTSYVQSVTFSPGGRQVISGSLDGTIRIWSKSPTWPKLSGQITDIHLSEHTYTTAPSPHMISLEGNPSIISACYSPDRTLYAASTIDGHVSLWHINDGFLWESDTLSHPIHLLRLSENRLIMSSPDGSILTWDVVDGKPTLQSPTTSGPQLNTTNIHQFRSQRTTSTDNSIVRWIPFEVDAGTWAYVDGTFIRFESVGGSVTFIDIRDISH